MPSRTQPSVGSCSAEVTKYAWRSRLTILGLSSRRGLLQPHFGAVADLFEVAEELEKLA